MINSFILRHMCIQAEGHLENSFTKQLWKSVNTVLVLSKLKKINATVTQPQRNVLKYFALFNNVAHSLEPGETPSYSASHQAPNYMQRSLKRKMMK